MNAALKNFDLQVFLSPDVRFAPVYSWVWNGVVSREKTDRQLEEMKRLGVRCFYIIPEPKSFRPVSMPTEMEPDYLTGPYFEEFVYAIEKGVQLGMECWLYDEGGWPSGGACGKVLWDHPELARRTLKFEEKQFPAGSVYQKSSAEVSAAFINGDQMIGEGHAFDADTTVTEYRSERLFFPTPGIPDYPDSLIPGSAQAFIEMTHEGYKKHLQPHFGKSLTMVFTDEPKTPPHPFREELCRAYEELYGESILPHLPVLAGQVEATAETAVYLRRWYDLCSRKFCENYLIPCRDWCRENGLLFTGHMDKDDEPMGCIMNNGYHIMRTLRCLDVPGVDAIWRQIFPAKAYQWNNEWFAENRFFPRYASSAAAQNGTDRAMAETFGVYGNGVTFDQMRFCAGFEAIRGINIINPMLFTYARKGHMMAGEHPAFDEMQACHRDLAVFNQYMERLCYVCSVGERVCDTALYYPVHDLWGGVGARAMADAFDALGWAMEQKQVDFDIVDDDVILQAGSLEQGEIRMGKACYRRLVIPVGAYLPEAVREALQRFVKAGGQVVTSAAEIPAQAEAMGEAKGLRVMKRIAGNGQLICLFNEGLTGETFRVRVESESGYYVNITSGALEKLTVKDGAAEIHLESGETGAIYMTHEALTAKETGCAAHETVIAGPFTFRAEQRFVLGDMLPSLQEMEGQPTTAVLGDWAGMVGGDFSGSCRYETGFDKPDGAFGPVTLDLGEVRYTCEVTLNGQNLGVKVAPPYRYDLPEGLLKEKNLLSVRVSNTAGNEYYHTRTFDKWAPWQLSTYHKKQMEFCRDTLASGLYGPVRLLY